MALSMDTISLHAKQIVKHFGAVVALSDGSLSVHSGEVAALVGANGSGKSTLSKIITGVVARDAGEIIYNGSPVEFTNPTVAQNAGITAVYQELSLVPILTVAENIWLAHEPQTSLGRIDDREAQSRTEELLKLFEGTFQDTLHPDAPVETLPPDEKQIVEILKAVSREPDILILDEATASLDGRQVDCLFSLIEEWKSQNMGLVFVSHRMDEIFDIADRVVVLRNGDTVGNVDINETTEPEIVSMMVGHEMGLGRTKSKKSTKPESEQIALSVQGLHTDVLNNVSFQVKTGELVGISGLRGQGQDELLHTLFGNRHYTGKVELFGNVISPDHPRSAINKDMALIPGDRATQGVLMTRPILENLHLPNWRKYNFPLNISKAVRDAKRVTDKLNVVMESLEARVNSLSGGNAQKIVIGKWLLREPRILLLDDPTKGVDVGTKAEFYNLLEELCAEGTTVLFYSSDDQELIDLSVRVLVMQDGMIKAELSGDDVNKANLVSASMGAGVNNGAQK